MGKTHEIVFLGAHCREIFYDYICTLIHYYTLLYIITYIYIYMSSEA